MTTFWRILFTPSMWYLPYEYSEHWDRKLNHLMDIHPLSPSDEHDFWFDISRSVMFGDIRVSAKVFPRSYGLYLGHGNHHSKYPRSHRPSRKTLFRLKDMVNKHMKDMELDFYVTL